MIQSESIKHVQLSYCSWSFQIFDISNQSNTISSRGWGTEINTRIGFKLQVKATLGFYSSFVKCYLMMWLFPYTPEDPENVIVLENHCAEALYSMVNNSMHAIWIENNSGQNDTALWKIGHAKPCTSWCGQNQNSQTVTHWFCHQSQCLPGWSRINSGNTSTAGNISGRIHFWKVLQEHGAFIESS